MTLIRLFHYIESADQLQVTFKCPCIYTKPMILFIEKYEFKFSVRQLRLISNQHGVQP